MFASVTFNFETREDLESALLAFAGVKRSASGTTATAPTASAEATADEQAEPTQAPEKAKRGRPAKTEPEQAEPTEPTRKAALGTIINAIRSFVLADKVGNMRKLIPLMPEGKKSLDSLDLEEAQRIVLGLGIEV